MKGTNLSWYKKIAQFIVLLLQARRLVLIAFGESDFFVKLHLGEVDLHVLLSIGQHDVSAVVVHAQIIYEEPRPDQVVQAFHYGASQEQHEAPFFDEEHLALDMHSLVHILKTQSIEWIYSSEYIPTSE